MIQKEQLSKLSIVVLTMISVVALSACVADGIPNEKIYPVITIDEQPEASVTVTAGAITGSLSVKASATRTAPLSYQWYKATTKSNADGTEIAGATSTSFAIPETLKVTESPCYYFCEVSSIANPTPKRSEVATVTIIPLITIDAHPEPAIVTEGSIVGSLTVGASVSEGATLSYQWYSATTNNNAGGSIIADETTASFEIPKTLKAAGSPYYYFCELRSGEAEPKRSNAATVTVTVAGQGDLPTVSTGNVTSFTGTTATICGNKITNVGTSPISERGVAYATSHEPTITGDKKTVEGTGTENFCADLEELTPNRPYYARAYATNTAGTAYGEEVEFTTTGTVPVLTTVEATEITANSARLGGNISNAGAPIYTERGVAYATTQNPTTDNSKKIIAGTGTGNFSDEVSGLSIFTEYYVRAYAINSAGPTAYGTPIKFRTLDIPPAFTMNPITDITENSAKLSVTVSIVGDPAYTDCGVAYATTTNPTIEDNKKTLSTTGAANTFTGDLTGLTPGTLYYVRPYATNAADTRYGEQTTFTPQKVTVGVQTGTLTAGMAGSVTFAVTTIGIANGSYTANVVNLPSGVTVQGQVAITNNAGTLTLAGNATTVAAVTNTLRLTIDGAQSAAFTLTIKGVTAGAQSGTLWAGYAGTVTFPITTAGIANGSYTASVANLPTGVTMQGQVTINNNTGTLTLSGTTGTMAGTYSNLTLTLDGTLSAAFTLTVSTVVHPTLTTLAPTDVTATSAILGGDITSAGAPLYIERGVVYATTPNPTTAGSKKIISGSGTGNFSDVVTGLTPYKTYYARAYAISSLGTVVYGQEVSFTPFSIMVSVEGGTFQMGSPEGVGRDDERPQHWVTLSNYSIGKYEVTQAQWLAVMGSFNGSEAPSSTYGLGDDYPMYFVSWEDVVGTSPSAVGYTINGITYYQNGFCYKLSQLAGDGRQYRLPTEAEWEYAARGGSHAKNCPGGCDYSGSNTVGDVAWYLDNSGNCSHPVGGKAPNELGIYDMSGNVWEFCGDWYGSYSSASQTNPTGPTSGSTRVGRGGGFSTDQTGGPRGWRVADRADGDFDLRGDCIGFRLACSSN